MAQSSELRELVELIEEGYIRKAWHGPNLRGAIRGLSARQAAWRPGPKRHSIREIVIHCSYWKYIVRRRILGEKKGSFYLKGSNWFPASMPGDEKSWRRDIKMLAVIHEALIEAVSSLRPLDLRRKARGSRVRTDAILRGIASHDVYHAGQIQLIKRFMR